jgi:hypothetical protein
MSVDRGDRDASRSPARRLVDHTARGGWGIWCIDREAAGQRLAEVRPSIRDTTLGIHLVDLPTTPLRPGARVEFTFYGRKQAAGKDRFCGPR